MSALPTIPNPLRAEWEARKEPALNRAEWRKFYSTPLWKKLRLKILAKHPLCQMGCGRISSVVDHIEPHKGDREKFWRHSNLQGLCKPCHDSVKKRQEMGRDMTATGPDGWPVGAPVASGVTSGRGRGGS